MNIESKVSIHNRFDIHIDNIESGEHREIEAYNIILDAMWNRLVNVQSFFNNIHFGGGTGTPTSNRTRLFTHIGTRGATNVETIKAFPLSSEKRKIVLNPEEFIGSTITEVGIAYDGGTDSLITHAMLKDSEGNPISITKTATDVVTIFATVYLTLQELSGGLNYEGLPFSNNIINYVMGSGELSSQFNFYEFKGANTLLGAVGGAWSSDLPNKKYKSSLLRAGISVGNGHIKHIKMPNLVNFDLPNAAFSGQPIVGVAIGVGDGVGKKFTLPSRNIRDNSINIKVGGVLTSELITHDIPSLNDGFYNSETGTFSSSCGISKDGSVAFALSMYGDGDSFIYRRINDVYVKTQLQLWRAYSAKISKDGSRLAVCGQSYYSPRVYNIGETNVTYVNDATEHFSKMFEQMSITENGNAIAMSSTTIPNNCIIYDIVNNNFIKRPQPPGVDEAGLKGIGIIGSGEKIVVAYSNKVVFYDWDGTAWTKGDTINQSDISKMDVTPDGKMLLFGLSTSPFVAIYEFKNSVWSKLSTPVLSSPLDTRRDGISINSSGSLAVLGINAAPFIQLLYRYGDEYIVTPNVQISESTYACCLAGDVDILVVSYSRYYPIIFDIGKRSKEVIFNNPPIIGAPVTADYTIDGIHKTDQFVLDLSIAIQFGEGV